MQANVLLCAQAERDSVGKTLIIFPLKLEQFPWELLYNYYHLHHIATAFTFDFFRKEKKRISIEN